MMLCTLGDVKALLNITDESKDLQLTLMIKQVSSQIEGFIGYKLERKEYQDEVHSVNFEQLLFLNNRPIQVVDSVKIAGAEITDFELLPQYTIFGALYRGNGWNGGVYTRGMDYDVVSGKNQIKATYTAGYYLPNDEEYSEGADDSLPFEIVNACLTAVSELFLIRSQNLDIVKSHSEGGISTTYGHNDTALMGSNGLSKKVCDMLEDFRAVGVA